MTDYKDEWVPLVDAIRKSSPGSFTFLKFPYLPGSLSDYEINFKRMSEMHDYYLMRAETDWLRYSPSKLKLILPEESLSLPRDWIAFIINEREMINETVLGKNTN